MSMESVILSKKENEMLRKKIVDLRIQLSNMKINRDAYKILYKKKTKSK